jgi:hypothetical protein
MANLDAIAIAAHQYQTRLNRASDVTRASHSSARSPTTLSAKSLSTSTALSKRDASRGGEGDGDFGGEPGDAVIPRYRSGVPGRATLRRGLGASREWRASLAP